MDNSWNRGEEWRKLWPPVRAAAAVSLCLALGEATGDIENAIVMAIGARRVILSDPGSQSAARVASLLAVLVMCVAAAFCGTLLGASLILSATVTFAVAFAAGLARQWGDAAGRAAVAPAVITALAVALPGNFDEATGRAIAIGSGGALGALFLLAHVPSIGETWRELVQLAGGLRTARQQVTGGSLPGALIRFALAFATVVALGTVVVKSLQLARGHWIVISMLVVLRPGPDETRQRSFQRIWGTLVGGALAVALVKFEASVVTQHVLIFLLSVGYFRLQRASYGWSIAFLTPVIVLVIAMVEPGNWHWAVHRVVDVTVGSLVALVAGLVLGRFASAATPEAEMAAPGD